MSSYTNDVSWLSSNNTSKTSSTSSTSSKNSSSSSAANILGKDDFLKLLITELKYQDPTKPMDNYEYISQMSTFSSLEQMQNLNSSFTELSTTLNDVMLPSMLLQQSSSMIGKAVTYTSTTTADGASTTKELEGVVESVVMKDGGLYYVIDGKEVDASKVTSMAEGSFSTNDQLLIEILQTLDKLLAYFKAKEGGTDDK